MPYFIGTYTIPPNVEKKNAIHRYIPIGKGIIDLIIPKIPPGVCSLAGFGLEHQGHRFFPSIKTQWFTGDDYHSELPVNYPVVSEPFMLDWFLYNEDIAFSHTIEVLVRVRDLEKETEIDKMLEFFKQGFAVGEGD